MIRRSAFESVPDAAVFGWRFRSEIPIPALPAWDRDATQPVDIELVCGRVGEVVVDEPIQVTTLSREHAIVCAEGVGRFSVEGGRKIVADLLPDALPGFVETMVLGPAFGTICYQRQLLPLHANTIVIGNVAVALSGRSGAGKSTLAATLLMRGHTLISDDVLPTIVKDGQTWALPGSQHLRLWAQTLDHLGIGRSDLRRSADGDREKYFLPSSNMTTDPWPLAALVWLERGESDRDILRPNDGALRFRTIYKAAYRQHLARDFAALGAKALTDISLPGVAVYDFWRLKGLELVEAQADMLEELAASASLVGAG